MSLNARLSVDINSEEFKQELVKALEAKMRHMAQQSALNAVNDSFRATLQEYADKAVEQRLTKMNYADECWLRDIIRTRVEQYLKTADVKSLVEAEIQRYMDMLNIPTMIKTEIQAQTTATAMNTIKDALSGIFKTE